MAVSVRMDDEKNYRAPNEVVVRTRRKRRQPRYYQRMPKRNRVFVARGLRAPVPYKLSTAMIYNERVTLSPSLGLPGVHVFSANGTFDPNITGVGHQPRGFDQMMALYDHNVVIYSEICVDYHPQNAGATITPAIAIVALRDFSSVSLNRDDYIELSDTVWKTTSPQGSATRIKMAENPNKFLGRGSPLSDPDLKNSNSSNATEQAYWHVALANATGTDPSSISVNVVIKYTVVFLEPKNVGQS